MRIHRLKVAYTATAVAMAMALAACGGGGGSDGNGNNSNPTSNPATNNTPATPPSTMTPVADGMLHAACTSCGAADDQTYSGNGVGIWQALNTSPRPDSVTVSLKNVTGKNVSLIFTNEATANQAMQSIPVTESEMSGPSMSMMAASQLSSASDTESPQLKAIHEFNQKGWAGLTTHQDGSAPVAVARSMVVAPTSNYAVGSTRPFWLADGTTRQTTLAGQGQATDGTTVNIWVQSSEYTTSKVTPQMVGQLLAAYAGAGGVYDIDTGIGGPLWGASNNTGMIAATGQPIDLVVANLTPDSKPYGNVGYYYALNNFANAGTGQTVMSNQDLSLYLDSETLYLGGTQGMQAIKVTMAHETEHMQNFYRRGMLMGHQYMYDTWLEETTAVMMEDWASNKLDSTFNAIRDNRFPQYLTYNSHGSYLCGLTTWDPMDTGCDSYSTNGAFGGFLNRQLGLDFYKALLNDKSSTDSVALLNDAIGQFRAGSSVAQELRHFTAAAGARIPLGANMSQYAFPARTDGGLTLPAIDPSTMSQNFASASPGVLLGLASFPTFRNHVPSTYQETVTVPPGTTLTVVVQ